jgi:hypothetical protein
MAHQILGKQFYAARGGAAWHGIGTVSPEDEKLTALELFNRSGGLAEVEMRKFLMVAMDINTGELVYSPTKVGEDGKPELLTAPGYGLWRWPHVEDDRERFFNLVSEEHPDLTNQEVCEILDASGVTKLWPAETMGLLDQGRAFFITLDAGEWSIKGDPMKMYLFAREGKDGKRSFNIGVTPVRIVCANTERLGLEQAEINIRVPHTRTIKESIGFYAGLIGTISDSIERMKEARARLADFKATQAQAKEVFRAAWPMLPIPQEVKLLQNAQDASLTQEQMERLQKVKENYDKATVKIDEIRDTALDLWAVRNEEIQPRELAGTMHIVFNTVTEVENYRRGRGTGTVDSILMGDRQANMTRAFQKAQALAV